MMNLPYMIELQGGLMKHIQKAKKLEEIPFDLTVTAFLVELGECMNEWRGFKYWSEDQEPRTSVKHLCDCPHCPCLEDEFDEFNDLLYEYVDGLHFVLQMIILTDKNGYISKNLSCVFPKEVDIDKQVKRIYFLSLKADEEYNTGQDTLGTLYFLIDYYLGLGEMLGFTMEQVEKAYIEKNDINHIRQRDGY